MLSRFNMAKATAFAGFTGLFTGIYVHHNTVKTNEEFAQKEFERNKELMQFKHNLELEKMDYEYLSSLSIKEALLGKLTELKDVNPSMPNLSLTTTDSVGPVTKALSELNSLNEQKFHISSVLEYIPLPVTASQHFAFSFFMFNVSIFVCLTGLILNHYFKLYGDRYLDTLPEWVLPFAKRYSKVREYSNYYYVVTIFVVNIMSMIGNVIMYVLG